MLATLPLYRKDIDAGTLWWTLYQCRRYNIYLLFKQYIPIYDIDFIILTFLVKLIEISFKTHNVGEYKYQYFIL